MINPTALNEFIKNVCDNLPPAVKNLPDNIEQKVRSAVLAAFAKMELVTRDEFDSQVKVLERTRIKLELLEKQLADSEKDRRNMTE